MQISEGRNENCFKWKLTVKYFLNDNMIQKVHSLRKVEYEFFNKYFNMKKFL